MYILSIECSTPFGSVVLSKNKEILVSRQWWRTKSQSEFLTSNINYCLSQTKITPSQLERIAVGIGPGSFTGVRIALNAARSLAFINDTPLYCENSLTLLNSAASHSQELPVFCALNAYKNLLFYTQTDDSRSSLTKSYEPKVCSLQEAYDKLNRPHLCLGDAFKVFDNFFSKNKNVIRKVGYFPDFPSATTLARRAFKNKNQTLAWKQAKPLYLRSSEAEEKLRGSLLRPS